MKAESCHFGMADLRSRQDKSIAWAKDVGIVHVVTATLGGGSSPTLDQVERAADECNRIAAAAAAAGMQQGLHHEGFEVSMVEGRRPQVAVGRGSIDWRRTFAAARTGGVQSDFVEQDWELTKQSVAYLESFPA